MRHVQALRPQLQLFGLFTPMPFSVERIFVNSIDSDEQAVFIDKRVLYVP